MTNNPADIAKLAAGLTEAQQRALIDAQWSLDGGYVVPYRHWRAFPGLVAKGLLTKGQSPRLTEAGIAVRNHLIEGK